MKHILVHRDRKTVLVYEEDQLEKIIEPHFQFHNVPKVGLDGYLYWINYDDRTLVKMDIDTEMVCWSKSFKGIFGNLLFPIDGSILLCLTHVRDLTLHSSHIKMDGDGNTLFKRKFEEHHRFEKCVGNASCCFHNHGVSLYNLSDGTKIDHPELPFSEDGITETFRNHLVTQNYDALTMYEYQKTLSLRWRIVTGQEISVELKFSWQGDKIVRLVHKLRCDILSVRDGSCLLQLEYTPIAISTMLCFSQNGNYLLAFHHTWKRYPLGGIQKIQSLLYGISCPRSLKKYLEGKLNV